MKKLMPVLMISCENATLLIEKHALKELSRPQSIQLKMHTAVCDACRQYQRQSILINTTILKHLSDITISTSPTEPRMGNQSKQQIQNEIEKLSAGE
jgi:hypothetical protein